MISKKPWVGSITCSNMDCDCCPREYAITDASNAPCTTRGGNKDSVFMKIDLTRCRHKVGVKKYLTQYKEAMKEVKEK